MALQFWLPLNGNINNQGLNPLTMSGSVSSWGNGKIGKCATFTSTSTTPANRIVNTTKDLNYINEDFSWSMWINPTNTFYGTSYIFTVGRADAGGYGYGANINSSGEVLCRFGNKYYIVNVSFGTWTHLTFCRQGNTIKIYKNGICDSTNTFSGTLPTYSDGNGLGLGCFWYSSAIYAYNGSINDFRIYNHCLSPKEVKEISKGLVLHYKMDDKIATNLLKNKTYSIYNNHSVPASLTKLNETFQGCDIYRLSMTPTSEQLSNFQSSLWARGICTTSTTFKANTKYCFWIYYRPISNSDVRVGGTASNINGWKEISPKEYGNGWYVVGQYRDGSVTSEKTDRIFTSFYCPSAVVETPITIDFCCPHLIEGFSEIIDDGDYQEIDPHTTVHDCSGFGNNGSTTSTNHPITDSDTPRYNSSFKFSGNNYISLTNLPTFVDMSVSFWMKPDSTSQTACLINYRNAVGNDISVFLISKYIRFDAGGQTNFTNYPFTTDWQHVCVTFNGSTKKKQLYVNGILKQEITMSSGINSESSFGSIGMSSSGSASSIGSNTYSGILSDYRIYATTLSADDVKELYNTSAIVCDNGTVMAYSLEE